MRIDVKALKEWLLKAVSLHKDHTGQVKIERVITRRGKTLINTYWVNPDKVESTDIVLAGHNNLPDGHIHKPVGKTMSKSVKNRADKYQATFPDKATFLDHLKKIGITWKENSSFPINFMRAKDALNHAIAEGMDLDDPKYAYSPSTVTPSVQPTPAQDKGGVIPQNVKDMGNAYAKKFNSRQDFLDKLKSLGITWKPTNDPRIEWMRAKVALNEAIHYQGFDITTETFSTAISPQNTAVPPTPPPPKDESLLEIPPNATEEQKVYIEHINRIKDLEHIRRLSVIGMIPEDERVETYLCEVAIPELARAYAKGEKEPGHMAAGIREGFKKDVVESKCDLELHEPSNNFIHIAGYYGIAIDMVYNMCNTTKIFLAKNKHLVTNNINQFLEPITMNTFINPIKQIAPLATGSRTTLNSVLSSNDKINLQYIIESLNGAFSDYTTDDYMNNNGNAYSTNMGYTGFEPSFYEKNYELEKEGFIRYLNKLEQNSDKDPEAIAKLSQMKKNYSRLMEIVKGNKALLNSLLRLDVYNIPPNESQRFDITDYFNFSPTYSYKMWQHPEGSAKALQVIDKYTDAILDGYITDGGCTYKDIQNSVRYLDDLKKVKVYDENGNVLKTINVFDKTDATGKPLFSQTDDEQKITSYLAPLILLKARKKFNMSTELTPDFYKEIDNLLGFYAASSEELIGVYNFMKQNSQITFQEYQEVHSLVSEMFGTKIDKTNWTPNTPLQPSNVTLETPPPNRGENYVYSNILLGVITHKVKTLIARENQYKDKYNNGENFEKNWDYYSPEMSRFLPIVKDTINGREVRLKHNRNPYYADSYTATELQNKINAQLEQSLVYHFTKVNDIADYYESLAREPGNTATEGEIASKDDFSNFPYGDDFTKMPPSPRKDLLFDLIDNLSYNVERVASSPKREDNLKKKLKYTPFNYAQAIADLSSFNSLQPSTGATPTTPSEAEKLKAARQRLYKKAVCTAYTESKADSDAMQKDIIENRFDTKPGKPTPDGAIPKPGIHRRRVLLFNSPMFGIRNTSAWEKRYTETRNAMITKGLDPKCYEEIEAVHGCARWSLPSIIGRTQGWFMGKELHNAGKMLGAGGYFAVTWGKSLVYAGDSPYSCVEDSYPREGYADGVFIMAKIMRGEKYRTGGSNNDSNSWSVGTPDDMKWTSLSCDAVGSIKDFEIAIKRNELILPHHFVDTTCRRIGLNVACDDKGNYYPINDDYKKYWEAYQTWKDNGRIGNPPKKWDGKGYTPTYDKNHQKIGGLY